MVDGVPYTHALYFTRRDFDFGAKGTRIYRDATETLGATVHMLRIDYGHEEITTGRSQERRL